MIGLVRDWLPQGVMAREGVRQALETAVAAWAARWFADGRLAVSSFLPCPGEARGDGEGGGWRAYKGGLALEMSARGAQRLVEKALDAPRDRPERTQADRLLLEGFERRLIDDLIAALGASLSMPPTAMQPLERVRDPFTGRGGVVIRLAEGGGPDLLSVAIPLTALLPQCRASLGPAPSGQSALQSLSRALEAVPVTVEATLGRVELGLRDLKDLAPGDVLVLDKGLNERLEITLPGTRGILAHAVLEEAGGGLALVFHD